MTSSAMVEMRTSATGMVEGSKAVVQVVDDLATVLATVRNVNQEIHDVSAVTEEMSAASEEVLASMEEVMSLATENAGRTQSVADASAVQHNSVDLLVKTIQLLNNSSATLRKDLEKFD